MNRERINRIRKRAVESWWEDGIVETVAGLGILLIGGIGLLGHLLEGKVPPWTYALMVVVIVAIAFAVRKAVIWAKRRWIWPYTGYAVVKGRKMRGMVWAYVSVFVLLGGAFLFPHYLPVISGAIGGCILLSIALSYGTRRFYLLALISVLLGVLLQVVGVEGERATYSILVALGVLETLLGTAQFLRFRKEVLKGEGRSL